MNKANIFILLGIILILTLSGLVWYLNNMSGSVKAPFPTATETPPTFPPSGSERRLLFPPSTFESYDSWDEINQILSLYDVEAEFVDIDSHPLTPTPGQKEKMRNSLTYFSYALDTYFKDTKISKFLERVEFCEECHPHSWVDVIKIPPAGDYEDADFYTITMIHEIAHSFNRLETYNQFRLICWKPNEDDFWSLNNPLKNPACQKDEESFIPQSLTADKGLYLPGTPNYYYSATAWDEDLAESIVAYAINPEAFRSLAEMHPKLEQKYQFVKTHVFEGKEF